MNDPMEKTWHTEDLDFDEHGRLVIKNQDLAKAIREHYFDTTPPQDPPGEGKTMDPRGVDMHCPLVILGGQCAEIPPIDGGCTEMMLKTPIRIMKRSEG